MQCVIAMIKITCQTQEECKAGCYQLSGIIHNVLKEQESLKLRLTGWRDTWVTVSSRQVWQMKRILCEGLSLTGSGSTNSERANGMLNQVSDHIYLRFTLRRIRYIMQKTRFYSLITCFKITFPFVVDLSDRCVWEVILEMVLRMDSGKISTEGKT